VVFLVNGLFLIDISKLLPLEGALLECAAADLANILSCRLRLYEPLMGPSKSPSRENAGWNDVDAGGEGIRGCEKLFALPSSEEVILD